MSEKVLLLLMELFAIAGRGSEKDEAARRKMEEEFLATTLSEAKAAEFLAFYDECIQKYHRDDLDKKEGNAIRTSQSLDICAELNQALSQKQKIVVIVRLIEYVHVAEVQTDLELNFLFIVGRALKIANEEYELLLSMIADDASFGGRLALIVADESLQEKDQRYMTCSGLQGSIFFAQLPSADFYCLRYVGTEDLTLNGLPINDGTVQFFNYGAIVRGENIHPIYYSEVVSSFLDQDLKDSLEYRSEAITFQFPNGKVGLHEINFSEKAGTLVAIMGGSGAGKSTLLNVLNGNAKPTKGRVTINGIDIHTQADELEGVIGFVSQSDILIEDLTVYQNLYFNSQLCFAGKDADFIKARVNELLRDIGLYEIRHLKVGSPLEKVISGGQRKRLNIALELIREPSVLFLDEPTSGLSSSDSEMVIDLLKSLTLKGKLVFVVIHQPSSQIFKLFDKLLLLDQGGYPIYQGNPVDAVLYFKKATHRINPDIGECACCGNVNPEQIFSIIEAHILNEQGLPTGERRFAPTHWHDYYVKHTEQTLPAEIESPNELAKDYQKPGIVQQFLVFFKRDVLAKLNNTQYMVITLLEAPVLAILLGYLSKYQIPGQPYSFQDNRNMVAYVFMSVIVMLFLGLMTSAEEIFRDRKIRERERFLNLSKLAYLKSKIVILMGISAIQSFLFVMIGNSILGFQEMYFEFWLMLFAVSLSANALGLNVSSAFKSAVTIYILIPFLIIPQLLLSGLLVRFDELHPALASRVVVPIPGELMTTRWAFEGLTVNLFANNQYESLFYENNKKKVNYGYYRNIWYPEIRKLAELPIDEHSDSTMSILKNEFEKIGLKSDFATMESIQNGVTLDKLELLRKQLNKDLSENDMARDAIVSSFENESGSSQNLADLRLNHFNDRIAELVLNQNSLGPRIYAENEELHTSQNSAYFDPSNQRQIRAHFYAPRKYFLGRYYSTFWVNLIVVFAFTFLLYIILYLELLERFINRLGSFSWRKLN